MVQQTGTLWAIRTKHGNIDLSFRYRKPQDGRIARSGYGSMSETWHDAALGHAIIAQGPLWRLRQDAAVFCEEGEEPIRVRVVPDNKGDGGASL